MKKTKRIISWNVNGIRAWYKKGALDWILKRNPDVFCVQETKAESDQLDEELRSPAGYFSYFESSKGRKGYSGTAIYTKEEPIKITYGLGKKALDQEGRQINIFFKKYVLINCYFPNGGSSQEKFDFKVKYFAAFLKYIKKLEKQGHKRIIFTGDVNIAHEEIDLARPKENSKRVGFLPMEREWVTEIIENGFLDTFRELHPNKVQYSWWDVKTRARDRNVGWRIDYFFVNKNLMKKVLKSQIMDEVLGSDHCPIQLEVEI